MIFYFSLSFLTMTLDSDIISDKIDKIWRYEMISVENEPQQIRLVCRWNEKIVQHTRSEWHMYLYKSYGNGRTCQYSIFRNSSGAYRWADEEKSCTRTHTHTHAHARKHAFTQTIYASTKIFAEKIKYSKIRSRHRQIQWQPTTVKTTYLSVSINSFDATSKRTWIASIVWSMSHLVT